MPSEVVPQNEAEVASVIQDEETSESEESEPEDTTVDTVLCRSSLQREFADAIVRLAYIDELKIYIKLGANVNGSVTRGLTPLHYAVWQRYPEAAEFLISEGCEINATDDIGYSPLHLASEHGYLNLVQILIRNSAQVNFNDAKPSDPYPMDVVDEPLRLAVKNDHYDVVRFLLENGANPNGCYFFGHEINLVNPLNAEMMELLLSFGADPNARDRQSLSPIMKACRMHQASTEELERRPDVSGRQILIHFAEMLKGMETVLLLISHGADVNMRTDARHDYKTVLHYAVLSGSLPIVNLLAKQGANVNFEPEYQRPTPLDLAILKGDIPMVKMLIEIGADVNASSPVLGSPLHVASSDGVKNRLEVFQMLLESGANPNQTIYNEDGKPLKTVLGEYVSSNEVLEVETVNLLLRYGAEVVMQNQNHHPQGILNDISNLTKNPKVLITLLEAAHCFDIPIIRKSSRIDDTQRQLLLKVGDSPMSLKHLVRVYLRKNMSFKCPEEIYNLMIPKIMQRYLLYEIS